MNRTPLDVSSHASGLIEQSWQRSALSGVDPKASPDQFPRTEIDPQTRLLRAAEPVLADLDTDLIDQRFAVILTDEKAQIVDRRFGVHGIGTRLDAISATPGTIYAEEIVGTTGLGTVREISAPVSVIGDEHFNDTLKSFCCFGAPIRNPLTRRLAGVLDLCGDVGDRETLFAPLIRGAVRRIEQGLVEQSGTSSRLLVADYHKALARRRGPLVAICDEFTLASREALDMLDPADYAVLDDVARDTTRSGCGLRVQLARGVEAVADVESRPGRGVLIRLQGLDPDPTGVDRDIAIHRETPVLVRGEPGSGRTTTARKLLGSTGVESVDAADITAVGEDAYVARLGAATQSAALIVENIHLLPDAAASALVTFLKAGRPRGAVALTCDTDASLTRRQQSLVGLCIDRIEIAPLRQRREEFPALVSRLFDSESSPGALRVSQSAMTALLGYAWPGNLLELVAMVRHVVRTRSSGTVTLADLPPWCRSTGRRGLTRIEQVEREAILDALTRHRGHRANAADYLGISHRTIYNRIRALRILESEYTPTR